MHHKEEGQSCIIFTFGVLIERSFIRFSLLKIGHKPTTFVANIIALLLSVTMYYLK